MNAKLTFSALTVGAALFAGSAFGAQPGQWNRTWTGGSARSVVRATPAVVVTTPAASGERSAYSSAYQAPSGSTAPTTRFETVTPTVRFFAAPTPNGLSLTRQMEISRQRIKPL